MAELADVFVSPPNPQDGFLAVSRAMLRGARELSGAKSSHAMAVTLLCGHGVETSLKAALHKCGLTIEQLSKLSHDLESLWLRAAKEGAPIASEIPEWLTQLNRVYDKPYNLRYPVSFHGIVLPNQSLMVQGSSDLFNVIEAFCK